MQGALWRLYCGDAGVIDVMTRLERRIDEGFLRLKDEVPWLSRLWLVGFSGSSALSGCPLVHPGRPSHCINGRNRACRNYMSVELLLHPHKSCAFACKMYWMCHCARGVLSHRRLLAADLIKIPLPGRVQQMQMSDVRLKQRCLEVLGAYHPFWLRLGLEIVVGKRVPAPGSPGR